jgi:hypothetical protein
MDCPLSIVADEVETVPAARGAFTVNPLEVSVCETRPSLSVTFIETV